MLEKKSIISDLDLNASLEVCNALRSADSCMSLVPLSSPPLIFEIGRLASPSGRLITKWIVPKIAYLRSKLSFTFSTMFSPTLLQDLRLPFNIRVDDIDASDIFFETVRIK
jgi:hypothetical protein